MAKNKFYIEIAEGFAVEVKVLEEKKSYGRSRYLVKPLAGYGEKWVENLVRK